MEIYIADDQRAEWERITEADSIKMTEILSEEKLEYDEDKFPHRLSALHSFT